MGVRYLSEGNYEEAIIAFAAAIEIDPKQPDAYLKASEAYMEMEDTEKAISILEEGLAETDSEEIQNRLDEIIVFRKLDKESVKKIAKIMIDNSVSKLKERNIKIDIDDSVVEYISNVGFDDSYGARPLRRAVQSKIEDKFAEELLDGNIKDGDHIKLMAKDDKVLMLSK